MKAKRLFSLLLLIAMVMSFFNGAAFASSEEPAAEEITEEIIEEVTEEIPVEEETPVEEDASDEPTESEEATEEAEEASAEPGEDAASEEPVEADASEEPEEDAAASHVHCVCGNSACTSSASGHDNTKSWTGWSNATQLPTGSGYYYLQTDVTLLTAHTVSAGTDITICLNGHIINTQDHTLNLITVETGAKLTVTDCSDTLHYYRCTQDGKWTLADGEAGASALSLAGLESLSSTEGVLVKVPGGCLTGGGGNNHGTLGADSDGGAVDNHGSFTLYGGNIIGNEATYGGGIYSAGTVNMYGGNILGNTACQGGGIRNSSSVVYIWGGCIAYNTANHSDDYGNGSGGGIYTSNKLILKGDCRIVHNTAIGRPGGGVFVGASSSVTVGGTPTIQNNTWKNGGTTTVNNLHVYKSGKTIATDGLQAGAAIGVTMGSIPSAGGSVTVTAAASSDLHGCFTSDLDYLTVFNNGEGGSQTVCLRGHTHDWSYVLSNTIAENDTVTAVCATACNYTAGDTVLHIVEPASLTVDGNAHDAFFYQTSSFLGGALPTIVYEYKEFGDGTYQETTDTTAAGCYKASFTVGEGDDAVTGYVEYVITEAGTISYVDADGETSTCSSYKCIDCEHMPRTLTTGWYVVSGTVSYTDGGLTVLGDVRLILTDGCDLTVSGGEDDAGICVKGSKTSLTVYAQSEGDEAGKLTAEGAPGIGGSNITVHGGTVNALGTSGTAGIGGNGSTVAVTGGKINASGAGGGEAIGADADGTAKVTLTGGIYAVAPDVRYIPDGYVTVSSGDEDYPYQIVRKHVHDWSYTLCQASSENDTVVATCKGNVETTVDGTHLTCDLADTDLTIIAPENPVYDGKTEYPVSLGGAVSFCGGELPEIVYEYKYADDDEYTPASNLHAMGHYRASVTVGEGENTATAYVEYTVGIDPVEYVDADGTVKECRVYTLIKDGNVPSALNSGWYVVSSEKVLDQIGVLTVSGSVRLLLTDGCSISVYGYYGTPGIYVKNDGGSLTIYGQEGGTGTLTVTGGFEAPGIGGSGWWDSGSITINGGTVFAYGGDYAPGIGGSVLSNGMHIAVNGGTVTLKGGYNAPGIGSGSQGTGAVDCSVNGGCVSVIPGSGVSDPLGNNSGGVYVTGGCFTFNPQSHVYTGYEVIDSGNPDYPYEVIKEHTHKWSYASDTVISENDTVTATCSGGMIHRINGSELTCTRTDTSLTIVPPTLLGYDGNSHPAGFGAATSFCGGKLPSIVYEYKSTEDGTYQKVTSTKAAGYYRASFTVGEGEDAVTGCVEYVIENDDPVSYLDAEGKTRSCTGYQFIDSEHMPKLLTSGWYVVSGTVRYTDGGLTILGDVHLILTDGCNLTVSGGTEEAGIYVRENMTSLTVYGQSEGDGAGSLTAGGSTGCAGIGGCSAGTGGAVTVNGGNIAVLGGAGAPGIGGNKITVNGGTVYALGLTENGAGIGEDNSTITITGGIVTAIGAPYAAGIGGNGSTVTVTGGSINASGSNGGEAIGADAGGTANVALTGGIYAASPDVRYVPEGYMIVSSGDGDYPYQILPEHSHNWSYALSRTNSRNDTVVATCKGNVETTVGGTDYPCDLTDTTLTIYAPENAVYDGKTKYYANLGDAVSFCGGELPEIVYEYKYAESSGYITATDFTAMGHYRASITVGSGYAAVTAYVEYTVGIDPVEYVEADGTVKQCDVYTLIQEGNLPDTLYSGWYVVSSETALNKAGGMTVEGAVNIILTDGCALNVMGDNNEAGIRVTGWQNSLTIYCQKNGTGALEVTGGENCAGIGGVRDQDSGAITINGGIIVAYGGYYAAAIGGGDCSSGKDITINGGSVCAIGDSYGAGIGGGYGKDGYNITINGGYVNATGGDFGAGIGGGYKGSCKYLTINEGTVETLGGERAAGIGAGYAGSCISLTIKGGTVEATGGYKAAGIGADMKESRKITKSSIQGGYIHAVPGKNVEDPLGDYSCNDYHGIYVTGGCFTFDPQVHVYSGYEVIDSGNSDYPYEVVEKQETPENGLSATALIEDDTVTMTGSGNDNSDVTNSGDTGSVFGGSSVVLLIVGAVVILGGGAACVIVAKKRKARVR